MYRLGTPIKQYPRYVSHRRLYFFFLLQDQTVTRHFLCYGCRSCSRRASFLLHRKLSKSDRASPRRPRGRLPATMSSGRQLRQLHAQRNGRPCGYPARLAS